jgi:hypothetical protein
MRSYFPGNVTASIATRGGWTDHCSPSCRAHTVAF